MWPKSVNLLGYLCETTIPENALTKSVCNEQSEFMNNKSLCRTTLSIFLISVILFFLTTTFFPTAGLRTVTQHLILQQ